MTRPADIHLADQIAAATDHADRILHRIGELRDDTVTTVTAPRWVRRQYAALTRAVMTGDVLVCPHLTGSPTVAHAAVWARWALTCGDCVHLLAPDPTETQTCDRCRTQGIPLYPCTLAIGPTLLAYGLCPPCMRRVHPDRTITTDNPDTPGASGTRTGRSWWWTR